MFQVIVMTIRPTFQGDQSIRYLVQYHQIRSMRVPLLHAVEPHGRFKGSAETGSLT